MLQRVLHSTFILKACTRKSSILLRALSKQKLCYQCGFRLSHQRTSRFLEYEKSFSNKNGLLTLRYYTSQVDAQKKNDHIDNIKAKERLTTSKKINVKLKTSEMKRLLSLAEPEKWTLTGNINIFKHLIKTSCPKIT